MAKKVLTSWADKVNVRMANVATMRLRYIQEVVCKYERRNAMIQAQIQLTEEQMAALKKLAKIRHISLSDLIREGIDNLLRSAVVPSNAERKQRALALAGRFKSGLSDLSRHHDEYLSEALDT